jgi:hypothetical protein
VLIAVYLEPLRENGLISKDEIKFIFGSVRMLRFVVVRLFDLDGFVCF